MLITCQVLRDHQKIAAEKQKHNQSAAQPSAAKPAPIPSPVEATTTTQEPKFEDITDEEPIKPSDAMETDTIPPANQSVVEPPKESTQERQGNYCKIKQKVIE